MSPLDLRLCAVDAGVVTNGTCCLLMDGDMGGEEEEESASTAGIEKGWSFSTSGSLPLVCKFLTEFSCRKIGVRSGGLPANVLMSMSGFGGIRGRAVE